MANRYSDIRRGAQLNDALTKYISYLQTPRVPNLNSRGARPQQQNVFVVPFNFDLATDEVIPLRASQDGVNVLATFINNAATNAELLTTIGSKQPVSNTGFKPAKVVYFRNTTRSVTVATSDITGRKYLKYAGDTYTAPFGRKTATDDQNDCFNAIKGLILAQTGFEIQRVSLQVEKLSAR